MADATAPGMVKLYFEEIPPVDEDEDGGVVMVEGSPQERDGGSSQSVQLAGGGMLKDLRLEAPSAGDNAKNNFRAPVSALPWPCAAAHPRPRGGCSLARLGDALFLFGGASREGEHFQDLWRVRAPRVGPHETVQPAHAKWEDLTAAVAGRAPGARSGHTATALEDRIVIFGGLNAAAEAVYNDLHELRQDGPVLSWAPLEARGCAPRARTEHSATRVGAQIVFFGGSSPYVGPLCDVHVLDTSALAGAGPCVWSTPRCGGPLPAPRELHSACLVVGQGGRDCQQALAHYGEADLEPEVAQATAPDAVEAGSGSPRARELREAGNACFVRGELEKAQDLYTAALGENPRCQLSYGNRSACRLKLGRPQEALTDALCAVRIDTSWGKAYFREAQACLALGRPAQAVSALRLAVQNAASDRERESMTKTLGEAQQREREGSQGPEVEGGAAPRAALCIFGGRSEGGAVLKDVCTLDLDSMNWAEGPTETPFPRCGHSCTPLDDQLFLVFGGWDGGMCVHDSGLVYDAGSGMWTECKAAKPDEVGPQTLMQPRFSHAACATGEAGALVTFGGVNFETDHADLNVLRVSSLDLLP